MKRHTWTITAVAALLVLLALAWRSPDRQKGLTDYEAAGTMRHIVTADIVALQVTSGPRRLRFERRNGAWLRADGNATTDAGASATIEASLRLLHNTPPERSFDSATPAFGLDSTALQVRAQTADSRVFEIAFGATNPMGLARYVRTRSDGVETLLLMPTYVAEGWEQLVAKEAR